MKLYISELYYINTSKIPGELSRVNISSHVKIYGLLTKCEVKMAGYWPSSFFFACLRTETESRSINSQEKRTRPISSHLDRTSLVNKGVIVWLSGKFFLAEHGG